MREVGSEKIKMLTQRRITFLIWDAIALLLSCYLSLYLRFDGRISYIYLHHIEYIIVPLIVCGVCVFYSFKLYSSLWRFASVNELKNIVVACMLNTLIYTVICVLLKCNMPRSSYIIFLLLLLMFIGGSRFIYRLCLLYGYVNKAVDNAKSMTNVMIIGAGDAGEKLADEIMNSPRIHKEVKCFIDDNPRKFNRTLHGIQIVGGRTKILDAIKQYKIDEIFVAIPSANEAEIADILTICSKTKCKLKRLPAIFQLINGDITISKLKEVEIQDLLGREPVKVDLNDIMGYVKDKVVMITGGGGSIGSELCRQIASNDPKRLIIIDIYENNAYDIQLELKYKYPQMKLSTVIGSVRDVGKIDDLFKTYRPDIVYHAAAHKHVPLMEEAPNEAVKNNVFGTLNVVKACDKYEVSKFILISTDKAVNPTSIMGATKRICEMIVQTYNAKSKTDFVAVRFGNVLGSNGSVIPLFKEQIAHMGPVTVTHPDIIRYFMTIPEAVSLVLQAGAYAKGGEIFILDMGEPVKIADMARDLIKLSGYEPDVDIKIEYTGLRPGEKLYEEMLMKEEGMQKTANKMIHIGKPIEINEQEFNLQLSKLYEAAYAETKQMKLLVQQVIKTYKPDIVKG